MKKTPRKMAIMTITEKMRIVQIHRRIVNTPES